MRGRSWKGPLKGPERLKDRSRSSRAKRGVSGRSSPLASRWRVAHRSLSGQQQLSPASILRAATRIVAAP
eukprot:15266811-Alexandrium_andersonii.AAC.1